MTKVNFTLSDFTEQLRVICSIKNSYGLELKIDDSKTWPHFCISCEASNTASIKGYFVESGVSYWQISKSGREVFTRNHESSLQFVMEIREVVHVLSTVGCTETRWSNQSGRLTRSLITIKAFDGKIIFGKRPPFWRKDLIKEEIKFVPYFSRPK